MGEEFQVLARERRDASEIAARDEFNRKHPPVTGLVARDLRNVEVPERPWRNNRGLWLELGANSILSAHIAELPPGGRSVRHRHTTEAYIYIVRGRGYSIIHYDGEPEQRIEWEEGTLFSPPRWAWHQHFNLDPGEPARYLAIQDTGLIRHMRLHQIERHPGQATVGDGLDYAVEALAAEVDDEE